MIVAAVAVALVAAAASYLGFRGGGSPPGAGGAFGDARLETYREPGLSFRYPASWRAQDRGQSLSLESNVVVALSNLRLHPTCNVGTTSGTCGFDEMLPAGLSRHGVLVIWSAGGPIRIGLPDVGRRATVGGAAARILVQPFVGTDTCGGYAAVTAYLANRLTVTADACDIQANTVRFDRQVLAMLSSVSFRKR